MNPVLFKLGFLEIHTVFVGALLFILVYLFMFWTLSRKDLKNNSIFDIAFITLFTGLLGARLLGMISKGASYLEKGWSFLPLTDSEDKTRIELFRSLPWSFFRFNDSNFVFVGLFLGIVIGLLIIYQNSNQKKGIFILFDRIVVTYAFAVLFLLAAIQYAGISRGIAVENFLLVDREGRYALQLIRIIVIAVFLLVYVFSRKKLFRKEGSATVIFMLIYGVSEFILRGLAEGYAASILGRVDYYQAIVLAILTAAVFFALPLFEIRIKLPFARNKRVTERELIIEPERIVRRPAQQGISNNPNRFMQSFSERSMHGNERREA